MEAANPFTAACRKAIRQEITADLLWAHRPVFHEVFVKGQWLRIAGVAQLASEKGQRCPPLVRYERPRSGVGSFTIMLPRAMHQLIPQ
jgi:hypothetical protein